MRYKTIFIIMIIFLASIAWSAPSIDAQIEAIKKAPPKERFRLMNRLKRQLVQMNQKQRSEAIAKLRAKTAKEHRMQKGVHGRVDKMHRNEKHSIHFDEHEKMQRMQYMQQHQMGSGVSHEMKQDGGWMQPPGSGSQTGDWSSHTDQNGMTPRGH